MTWEAGTWGRAYFQSFKQDAIMSEPTWWKQPILETTQIKG